MTTFAMITLVATEWNLDFPCDRERFFEEGFEEHRKKTRREQFLENTYQAVPWKELAAAIAPHYPQPKGAGRRPIGVERMLRIHFLQHWFNLCDPAVEEALYDSRAMRRFVGIDLVREPVPEHGKGTNGRPKQRTYRAKSERNGPQASCLNETSG